MSREVAFAVIFLTTVTFAALFAYEFVKGGDGTSPTNEQATESNNTGCPYYPMPQKIDFQKDKQFEELFAWLDDYVNSTVDENSRPSVSANLVYLDQVVWNGYFGRLSKQTDEKPNENTIYRIASISKLFPVLYLFKLWEDEKLDLYDPITKYAPDFTLQPALGTTDDINLIDIASQISGLPGALPFDLAAGGSAIIFNGSLEDALMLLRNETLVERPHERCIYSNLAYALLGSILARNFSDGNFTKWAQENVVDALGLTGTGFTYTDAIKDKMATGYLPNDGGVAPIFDLLWYGPAGNYYSTLGDLTRIAMSFLETSNKAILKHKTLVEMMRSRKTCRHGYLAGLADITGSPWEMNELHGNLVVSKDGDLHGYSSTMALVPSLKLSFNVLMSGTRGENVARKVLDKAIPTFRNALRRLEQKVNPTPDPEKYTGKFTYYLQQNQTITAGEDGALLMENPIEPGRFNTTGLSYVAESVFRLVILGGEFSCNGTLDAQNGVIVHFKKFDNGKYNEFDIPDRYVYGYKRL